MLHQRQLTHGRHGQGTQHHRQQHAVLSLPPRSSSCSTAVNSDLRQQLSGLKHGCRVALVRSAPEKVQEQEMEVPQAAAPPSSAQQRQFVRSESMTTMQEEQERELKTLTTDLPRQEQRFEWLAFWVASAVAFGAGIW